jgi:uncharacterized cupredoxin-like copper-binding protein
MKRMLSAMLVCLPLSMAPAMVAAESGPERLQRVVDELQSLQAEFEQTVLDSDFVVDEVDFHLAADRDETAVAGLVFDAPGTYVAYCSVPGHRDAGMELEISVG